MAPAPTDRYPPSERPLIGVSAWEEPASWGVFRAMLAFAEAAFVEKLAEVGADSVIIPPQPHLPADLIRNLDGIVLTGGPDIQSPRYAPVAVEPQRPEVGRRDALELALAMVALEEQIPILGVCRGCQVINVVAGGTLVPEVADRFDGITHTLYEPDGSIPFEFAEHEVSAVPGGPIEAALGPRFGVLSSHHQAIDRVAPEFQEAAHSPDGLIEAIHAPGHPFAVGIQWHPEAGADASIFAALANAARLRADARRMR